MFCKKPNSEEIGQLKVRIVKLEADVACMQGRHQWEAKAEPSAHAYWRDDFNKPPFFQCKNCYARKELQPAAKAVS